jgi:hypothetical protein
MELNNPQYLDFCWPGLLEFIPCQQNNRKQDQTASQQCDCRQPFLKQPRGQKDSDHRFQRG